MQLLIVRHAIAEDREAFARTGRSDADRPLTDFGRRRMRKAARGLRRVAPAVVRIGTSPLLRAADTARLVAESLGDVPVEVVEALAPGSRPADLLPWLEQQPADGAAVIVGHDPDLGELVTWLVSGTGRAGVEFKKGGACLLHFREQVAPGTGVMQWLLTPSQMRALSD